MEGVSLRDAMNKIGLGAICVDASMSRSNSNVIVSTVNHTFLNLLVSRILFKMHNLQVRMLISFVFKLSIYLFLILANSTKNVLPLESDDNFKSNVE